MHRLRVLSFALIFALIVFPLLSYNNLNIIHASTLTVTNLNDSDAGSLRQAIIDASANDTISFAADLNGTITVITSLVIDKNLTINGPGANVISISGNDVVQIFQVLPEVTAQINNLTITHGNGNELSGLDSGGGIINRGTLTINNSVFSYNYPCIDPRFDTCDGTGGGIHNIGNLTVNNSTFHHNSTSKTGVGAAIASRGFNTSAELTINNSTFTDNSAYDGGAIFIYGADQSSGGTLGIANINNSTFSNNSATEGGAITTVGATSIDHSLFTGNKALVGGAIKSSITNSQEILTINNTTLSGNEAEVGGAIQVDNSNFVIKNSTISNNFARSQQTETEVFQGGGVYILDRGCYAQQRSSIIANTTIANNSAATNGGGIYYRLLHNLCNPSSSPTFEITNTTIANNTAEIDGQSFFFQHDNQQLGPSPVKLKLKNTIVSTNSDSPANNCAGVVDQLLMDGGNNLQYSDTSCGSTIPSADPMLNNLGNNGGPTQTMMLQTGSPAIDAGNNSFCEAAPVNNLDQRGGTRPYNSVCDIGSVEFGASIIAPPTVDANGPYTANEGSNLNLSATGSDPQSSGLTYAWDLDNNGTFETTGQSVNFAAVDGPKIQQVNVKVTNAYDLSATASTTVTINNVAPSVSAIIAPVAPVLINTSVNVSATFTDPGVLDTHTAIWDWGDGTTTSGVVNGGNVTGSHTYTVTGVYSIGLSVKDSDNDTGSAAPFEYLVVYNPTAGFVTGAGSYNSPAGAYPANPSLSGKAKFGFNIKYATGMTVPTGDFHFQFPGNASVVLTFESISYNWLVINGNNTSFKGTGSVDGVSGYSFLVSTQTSNPDLIRIKIWNTTTNAVVYDSQPNAADTAIPTIPLQNGKIQMH